MQIIFIDGLNCRVWKIYFGALGPFCTWADIEKKSKYRRQADIPPLVKKTQTKLVVKQLPQKLHRIMPLKSQEQKPFLYMTYMYQLKPVQCVILYKHSNIWFALINFNLLVCKFDGFQVKKKFITWLIVHQSTSTCILLTNYCLSYKCYGSNSSSSWTKIFLSLIHPPSDARSLNKSFFTFWFN